MEKIMLMLEERLEALKELAERASSKEEQIFWTTRIQEVFELMDIVESKF